MAAQSDWWWNFRPTGYNALAWSGSEGNAAQRFLLCSVVLKPTHTQLSPGKFLYYLWEIISESITDADEEASFRYGSDTDRMVGMSNPAVWIIHSDQPHSPSQQSESPHQSDSCSPAQWRGHTPRHSCRSSRSSQHGTGSSRPSGHNWN